LLPRAGSSVFSSPPLHLVPIPMLSESAAVVAPYPQLPCLRDSASAASSPYLRIRRRIHGIHSVRRQSPSALIRWRRRRPHLIRSLIERCPWWINFRRRHRHHLLQACNATIVRAESLTPTIPWYGTHPSRLTFEAPILVPFNVGDGDLTLPCCV